MYVYSWRMAFSRTPAHYGARITCQFLNNFKQMCHIGYEFNLNLFAKIYSSNELQTNYIHLAIAVSFFIYRIYSLNAIWVGYMCGARAI